MKFGPAKLIVLSLLIAGGLIALLNYNNLQTAITTEEKPTLRMYCAAGIKKPVDAVAADYEKEFGIHVEINYAASGDLLGTIEAADKGDIYLAADNWFIEKAKQQGLIEEVVPLAKQYVTLIVRQGNPKQIKSIDDLLKPGVKFSLAKPKIAAASQAALSLLGEEKWKQLWNSPNKIVERIKVDEVAGDVEAEAADAGIVWDATAINFKNVQVVPVPQFEGKLRPISASVLKASPQPDKALHFLRYMSAQDKGLKRFAEFKYSAIDGDAWKPKPELTVFVGGVLKPPTKQIIAEFELREGVKVNATYAGCGLLVTQMRGGLVPDLYFACDTSFMVSVQDLFGESTNVISTDMVMIVPAGNPKQIKTLQDLDNDELKIGLCDPDKSALGFLCQRLLSQPHLNLWNKLYGRAKDHPSTADVLVGHVANNGSLDAAIVYRANTRGDTASDLEVIPIDDRHARAIQPVAVRKDSPNRQLALRLMDKILAPAAHEKYRKTGFDPAPQQVNP